MYKCDESFPSFEKEIGESRPNRAVAVSRIISDAMEHLLNVAGNSDSAVRTDVLRIEKLRRSCIEMSDLASRMSNT